MSKRGGTRRCTACDLFSEAPPHDAECERAVLACLALCEGYKHEAETVKRIVSTLDGGHFALQETRRLWESLERARRRRVILRGNGLMGWLKKDGVLADVPPARLLDVLGAWWMRAHVDWYVRRLKEVARHRLAIEGTWGLVAVARERPFEEWLAAAKGLIAETDD